MAKTAVLELLDSPKLISRKIWVTENPEISKLCCQLEFFREIKNYLESQKWLQKQLRFQIAKIDFT